MSSKRKYNSLRNHELTKRNYFYHLILRKVDQIRSLKVLMKLSKFQRKDVTMDNVRIYEFFGKLSSVYFRNFHALFDLSLFIFIIIFAFRNMK